MDSCNHHHPAGLHQPRAGFRHGLSQRLAALAPRRRSHGGGYCLGVLVHVSYTLLGLGWMLQQTPWLFTALKLAGAAYLIYLGIKMLRARPDTQPLDTAPPALSDLAALRTGFLTNALNPKTSIFIVSLFMGVVRPDTGLPVQIAYGLFIAGAHVAWFSLVALCFSAGSVREKLMAARQWIDRAFGGLLVSFGVSLTLAQRSD
jgi:threonine/homoserine/homoserine lactone efflux protein